jgi:alcohol dehydrogenase (cytochrome c)
MKRMVWSALLLLFLAVPSFSQPFEGAGADWTTYNGTIDSRRYSMLDQITTENVAKLQPVWAFQTGTASADASFECTPLVVDGWMYVTTPDDVVYKLNAATGELCWTYDPKIKLGNFTLCCGHVNRGVAYHNGKVYIGTLDARLIALDAETGCPVKEFGKNGAVQVEDPMKGYSETAAPVIWDGKIFYGVAGGELRTRCFIAAYDAETGKQLWKWFTIPADDDPDPKVRGTWPMGKYKTGGVGVWMNPTIDVKNRQVIFATGNPNPDFDGIGRKGDNLFSCSVVAVDADTGARRWYFQEVRHDLWDYDQSAAPVLFTAKINGESVDAVGFAGKTGWFYVLDRKTGESLYPLTEIEVPQDPGLATARTQRVPAYAQFITPINMWKPPTKRGVVIAPAASGGSEWSPHSISPRTNYAYIAAVEKPMLYCLGPFDFAHKGPKPEDPSLSKTCVELAIAADVVSDFSPLNVGGMVVPTDTKQYAPHGAIIAIDLDRNQVVWRHEVKPHPIGGSVVTAGDVLFAGEANGSFDALNARTGEKLWSFSCGAGVNAAPMTYAVGGRQYVAVSAGGLASSSLPNRSSGDPNSWKSFRSGDTVFVFALPSDKQPPPRTCGGCAVH